jgi:hypothetical protein
MVKEGAPVDGEDARLMRDDPLRDPVRRVMRAALRSIALRPRSNVGLDDGLQAALDRSLAHTVAAGRDREPAPLGAPLLGHRLPSIPPGALRPGDPFLPSLLAEDVHAAALDGPEGHPVDARGALVCLG